MSQDVISDMIGKLKLLKQAGYMTPVWLVQSVRAARPSAETSAQPESEKLRGAICSERQKERRSPKATERL
jgi:hypothetical protein